MEVLRDVVRANDLLVQEAHPQEIVASNHEAPCVMMVYNYQDVKI